MKNHWWLDVFSVRSLSLYSLDVVFPARVLIGVRVYGVLMCRFTRRNISRNVACWATFSTDAWLHVLYVVSASLLFVFPIFLCFLPHQGLLAFTTVFDPLPLLLVLVFTFVHLVHL